jgi:hypothetical protein
MTDKFEALNEVLINISHDVDKKIAEICLEYGLDPHMVSTIILARLFKMNESVGNGPGFIKMMRQCADDTELHIHQGDERNVH